MDSLLACKIDPYVIVVGGTVRPSAKQFFAAPRTHAPNPASGSPSAFTDLRLTRFPFEVLLFGSEQDDELTGPARWLGYCMGDGTHNTTCVTTADPEVRQKVHQLVAARATTVGINTELDFSVSASLPITSRMASPRCTIQQPRSLEQLYWRG
ncbi:hypothetical protein BCV69DRAFT_280080 [Microstroma glucosiphilum]|uniref:Uncharacterized protein n=1 Tax=Pseudomicrostroma glucosiphilum TaxID=1684307 RepID=A0A316ULV7_9BASI|nr:hypothetical protein BCV69DRAFT_280080 [Pseudomicrostroma glucosiphilum]PWN24185.1 hypothetical protein BCV69DRAFT_280080 [Pseudomicrostroma glucosiphilum]